ncbi:MAG: Sec-dependent nitrous-oxide reductase [Tepidiformaceae bacterium]
MALTRRRLLEGAAVGTAGLVVGGVAGKALSDGGDGGGGGSSGLTGNAQSVANARGLATEDITRAVQTFVPPGQGDMDEFFLMSSGGHSGQVIVMGVPSMRILKQIGVFTRESWQGHGFGSDASDPLFIEGTDPKKRTSASRAEPLTWGDTHHPALSETNGEYDGRWLYINDRANGRIAMIDLRDFKTKQILDVPNLETCHGGAFITPNSEYCHISTLMPTLVDDSDIDNALKNYKDVFRGFSTFLAINPANGRFDMDRSFQLELPPYNQDLADAGKLDCDGWMFINSYNTEMAIGGNSEGGQSLEIGASKNDYDMMHMINWKKAEEVVKAGKTKVMNGMRVIPLETSVAEGILFLAPEPRSPHGVDVSPNGAYLTVSGKLDPHVTVYSWEKVLKAMADKDFEKNDDYGIPILRFDSIVAGRVEVGAGPLHTQYDDKGYGYTSLFIESAVAKWSLGEPYHSGDKAYQLVDKLPINFNIGHLCTMQGDTTKPAGKYLIALNKWSIDRFPKVGTLKPQNFQLIDISGEKMTLLTDTPIGVGEPHYVQGISRDKLKPWDIYPPGTNPLTMEKDPHAIANGEERMEKNGSTIEIWSSVTRSRFKPDTIRAKAGDKIIWHLTNVETTPDATHGFAIPRYNIEVSLDAGECTTVEFVADAKGTFAFYCTEFCSALHMEMQGWLLVS